MQDGAVDKHPAAVIVDAAAYAQAVEDAVKASAAYYAGGTSVDDDASADQYVRGIAAWESAHPDEVLPDSPTGKVAVTPLEGDVPHGTMLSLDNVFSPEEFTAWTASLARRIGHDVARTIDRRLDRLRDRRPVHPWSPHPADHAWRRTAGEDVLTPSAPSKASRPNSPTRSRWRCAAKS